MPQLSNWPIYTIGDRIVVDRIVRYKNLAQELVDVAQQLGLPRLDLPHAKGSVRIDRRPDQEWYTPRTRERVAEVFAREIEQFGWTFN